MSIRAGVDVLFVVIQLVSTISTTGAEQQPYAWPRAIGEVEVRLYPGVLIQ